MAKNEFPKKGCSVNDMIKFLKSQGYESKNNGSSHMIFRCNGKPTISLVSGHGKELAPGTWRNIYKDFYGIPH